MDKKLKITNAFLASAIVVSVFVVVATILGELYKPFKNMLAELHGHHWVGKGIWSAVVFVAVGALYYVTTKEPNTDTTTRLMKILSWMAILVTLVLFIFFIYEYVIHH